MSDSTRKSTSALASLNTAPPSCVKAPSISTTSKLVVPSTSISPEMSKLVKTEVPAAVTMPVVVRFSLPKLIAPELSVTLPDPIVSVPVVKVSNQPFNHLTPVEPKLSVLSVSEIISEPL